MPHDVFPEEFASFLLGDPRVRELFLRHHADLLEPEFWQECQRRVEAGEIVDFFPYPESLRFQRVESFFICCNGGVPVPLYQAKAELFRTLGHPVRIRVLELLQDGPKPVRDLLAEIEVEASNLSQQLAVLRRAGMVTSSRDGALVRVRAEHRRRGGPCWRPARRILTRDADGPGRAAGAAARRRRRRRASAASPWPACAAADRPAAAARGLGRRCAAHPRRDLLAGLTVAVVALPLALAFGVASGLGAQAGLVTAVVAGALAAVFGGSNLQVSGPTGAMTVVLVPVVQQFGAAGVLMVGADGRAAS